jgi:hypothetical protein
MADAAVPAKNDTEKTGPPWQIKDVSTWPGAFGAFKYSQSAVILNLSTILILYVIGILVSFIQPVLPSSLYIIIYTIVTFVLYVVEYKVFLASAKGKKLEIGDAVKESMDATLILNMLGLAILVGASIVIGFILLIIPGLIILPRLVLAPYFLLDQKLDMVDAYKASWNATKGHSWKVWGIIGAAIVMFLPVLTIIGIPLTIYLIFMYSAVSAVLYEYIKKAGPAKS